MANKWDDRANNGDLDPPVFWHLKRLGRRPPPLAKTLCCQARNWWRCWEHSGGWAEGPQQQKTWRDLSGGLAGTKWQLRKQSSSACQAGCQQQRRWRPSGGLVHNGRGDGTPLEALEEAANEEDGSPLEDSDKAGWDTNSWGGAHLIEQEASDNEASGIPVVVVTASKGTL